MPTPSTAKKPSTISWSSGSRRELWAALVAAVLGLPAVFLFARAMADSEVRRREAPVRAMIGNDAFERLAAGETPDLHYYGSTLSAPDFELPDQRGKPWRLSDARGKVVVMNFWTITCQPCVEEMPGLIRLAKLAADNPDIEVVAVTSDKRWSDVAPLFPPDSSLKVLFDPKRKVIRDAYGSKLFPETWVIDRNGVIRLRVDGRREWGAPLALDVIHSFL